MFVKPRYTNQPRHRETVFQWGPPALYIALLYFRDVARVVFSRERTEALLVIVLCLSFFAAAIKPGSVRMFRRHGEVPWALTFLGLVCISALASAASIATVADVLYRVCSVSLLFLVFAATARSRAGLTAICTTLAICAATNAGIGLWGAVTHRNIFPSGEAAVPNVGSFGFDASSGRSGGIIGENYSGMCNVPAVVAGMALLRRKESRLLGGGLLLLAITGTVVSVSRASIMAVSAAVCVFVALTARRVSLAGTAGALIPICLLTGVGVITYRLYVYQLPIGMQRAIANRFSQDGAVNDPRAGVWRLYADEALRRPLLGNGPGYVKDRVRSGGLVPHNSFLDVAVQFGLPAMAMIVIAVFRLLATFRAARKTERGSYLYACFVGMLIPLLTLSSPFLPLVWAIAGALMGVSRNHGYAGLALTAYRVRAQERHVRFKSAASNYTALQGWL